MKRYVGKERGDYPTLWGSAAGFLKSLCAYDSSFEPCRNYSLDGWIAVEFL
jgi:hypothetical protein